MRIRVINNFHNVDTIVNIKKPLTMETYKRHVKKGCDQKDCLCDTRIYMEVGSITQADMYTKNQTGNPASAYWKQIDPLDLELKDAGYGVKL